MGSEQSSEYSETKTVGVHSVVAHLQIRNETNCEVELSIKCPSLLESDKRKVLLKRKRLAPKTTITTKLVIKSNLDSKEVYVWAHSRIGAEKIQVNLQDQVVLDVDDGDLVKLALTKRR
ncbi:uncharacterized protein [Clytia hemisphaerica]|uniref:uncharacterized protein n=1 Tax=Clytia hemisphaerica TaxID=252671 RepID=UPI0034D45003